MYLEGLINEADIAGLGVEAFRRVINKLVEVEASIHRIPLADLDLTAKENDPDAGIDARVQWPDDGPHDHLFGGENVLQYKTGRVTKAILTEEFHKPGVQNCLKRGGHYHFLVSQDYNPSRLDKLRAYLKALCVDEGIDEGGCQILAASHIARWICRHPAVIAARELGKGLPGFSTVETWAETPTMRNPWKADGLRLDIIARVQAQLGAEEVPDPVIRIEGPTGVGKSRLALECIKAAGLANRVIYAPYSGDTSVQQLLVAVQGSPRSYAIVVADECDRERQAVFKSFAELSEGRLRLICVGPGDVLFDSPADFGSVFVLPPIGDGDMKEILSARGEVPPEASEAAVRLSGGYPKLAFFVADAILRDAAITPVEIQKIRTIKDVLNKFLAPATLKALRAAALLERLGWEGDLQAEAQAVTDYLGLNLVDFRGSILALREQGVVLPQGRYIYVTPDLLGIAAAAELWDAHGGDLIRIIEKLPGLRARRELLKRLAGMGRHREVRKVVQMLLSEDGLFKSLEDLDEEFRSEAFRIMSSALPDAAVTVLARIIERAPREQLEAFKTGRRNVIWAIETLLRWPETSLVAARSLRSLALAENEEIGNNATGVFAEYFQVHLSRSPIPYRDRMVLLDELIAGGDEASRKLGVAAAKAGLVSYETRLGGNFDELARRPYPPEWRPKTYAEHADARRVALKHLEEIACGNDEAASDARNAQIASTFTLTQEGLFDDAIKALQSVEPKDDTERREFLDACLRLESEAGEKLSEQQKKELMAVRSSVFDSSYFASLKRWVGRRLHADFDLEGGTGEQQADRIAEELAEEGLARGMSDEELAWLASPEAENVWVFGLRLGELDGEMKFFKRIVASSSEDVNTLLLAAYFNGTARRAGNQLREDLLDGLCGEHPQMALGCTWRGEPSERGLQRIIDLVESGKLVPESVRVLMYGGWTKSLSGEDVGKLVTLMLRGNKIAVLDASMSMLQDVLQRDPQSIERLDPLVWQTLELTPANAAPMVEWRWRGLAAVVAPRDPQRIIHLIVRQYSSEPFIPLSDDRQHALQVATQSDPVAAWNVIGDAILNNEEASSALLTVLRKWYGELIPIEHLISWARAHQPRGPRIVAHLVNPAPGQLSGRARALVLAFPGKKEVWTELFASLVTGFSFGPYSNRIEMELATVRQWAEDPDPEFRSWAMEVARGMEAQLRHQKTREEEGDI